MDDEKTVINVKGVSVRAWERARSAARRDDASMGEWLTRAISQLADLEEAGPREIAPDNLGANPVLLASISPDGQSVNPAPMEQIAQLLHAIAAVGASPGVPLTKANIYRANRMVADAIQSLSGIPTRKRRLENRAILLEKPDLE